MGCGYSPSRGDTHTSNRLPDAKCGSSIQHSFLNEKIMDPNATPPVSAAQPESGPALGIQTVRQAEEALAAENAKPLAPLADQPVGEARPPQPAEDHAVEAMHNEGNPNHAEANAPHATPEQALADLAESLSSTTFTEAVGADHVGDEQELVHRQDAQPVKPTAMADHPFSSTPTLEDPLAQKCNVTGCEFTPIGHPEFTGDVLKRGPGGQSGQGQTSEIIEAPGPTLEQRVAALEAFRDEINLKLTHHGIIGPR
jgi:hypothetical protein